MKIYIPLVFAIPSAAATFTFPSSNGDAKNELLEIFELDKRPDLKTLKKQYYKLSRKYHPDKNQGDPTATAHFQRIKNAYEILQDDVKYNQLTPTPTPTPTLTPTSTPTAETTSSSSPMISTAALMAVAVLNAFLV